MRPKCGAANHPASEGVQSDEFRSEAERKPNTAFEDSGKVNQQLNEGQTTVTGRDGELRSETAPALSVPKFS